ncbi:peroxiredoxin family protein [Roseivirga sp.]|uniref:peroxiredoxin family protein n=1 Tax=Roseivirga sp. TaxID=1964215 RepID=UPI003B51554A
MRKLLTLTFSLLFSVLIQAQTYDFLDPGLKRLTSQKGIQIVPQALDGYYHTGEKIAKEDIMLLFMDIDYQPAIYIDERNEPKVIVFEKASEEAKLAKIRMFENRKSADFMLNEKAPDFTLKDMDGNDVTLDDLKGEVVLLNFWFVGCKPCIMEMPELNELVKEFKPHGVRFLAIGLDNPERVKAFLEKQDFNYTLLPNGRRVAGAYSISSYPTHLLLNEEGKVVFSQIGYFPGLKYALRKRLEEAVKE